MLPRVLEEVETVKEDFSQVQINEQPDGSVLLEIQEAPLPEGWNLKKTKILVILPAGYPQVLPSGFCADPNLRLHDGRMPSGASQVQISGNTWLRFCWQPKSWDSSQGLWKFMKIALERFRLLQ